MTPATWRKGNRTVSGRWRYNWASDRFLIELDKPNRLTGERRQRFWVHGDRPEFNGFVVDKTVGEGEA